MRLILFVLWLLPNLGFTQQLILSEDNIPPIFTASYSLSKGSLTLGETQVSLNRPSNKTWEYYSSTQASGIAAIFLGSKPVTDRTRLKIIKQYIKPIMFEHIQIKGSKNRSQRVEFDWQNNSASASYKDRNNQFELNPGIFDNFSMQLLLMANINQLPKEFTLPIISKAKLKDFYFYLIGPETIKTPIGEIESVLIERRKDNDKNSTYRIWADPKKYGLPIQIEKLEDGKSEYIAKITNSSLYQQ